MTRHIRAGVTLTALLALTDAAVAVAQPFPRALARPRERTIDTRQAPNAVDPSRRTADTGVVPPGVCDGTAASSQACADAMRASLSGALATARAAVGSLVDRAAEFRSIENRLSSVLEQFDKGDRSRAIATGVEVVAELRTLLNALYAPAQPASPDQTPQTGSSAFLPGADVSTGTNVPEVTLRAADVYFTDRWRLYVRTTVAIGTDDDATESATEGGDDAGEADSEPSAADVEDSIKSALLNPTGGLLSVSAGYYQKLTGFGLTGKADDASHGLFFDARAGVRFLEMPDETLRNADGPSSLTPLLSASLGGRLVLPVFKEANLVEPAGGVELHAAYLVNHFTTRSSALLRSVDGKPAVLGRTTQSLYVSAAVALSTFADISISGTLWSNTDFDRRLMVSIGLVKND